VLEVVEVREPGRIRVRVLGELDLAGAPALSERLRSHRERGTAVLLDLEGVDFIDMSGLRVVLSAAEQASHDGGAFAVTRGSRSVRRLAALVELDGRSPFDGDSA